VRALIKRNDYSLAVAELVFADLGGYIQTNLMSMTDGHLYFDSDLHNAGRRPAINTFLSVTASGFKHNLYYYKILAEAEQLFCAT